MSFWFADEVLWIKLVCLDWVYPCGTCIVLSVLRLIMFLYLWNYIPTCCALLTPCLIILESATSLLTYIFQCSSFPEFWGNICQLCLANFSLFDPASPLSSSYYSCLASSLVLTVFFGSRRICHCEGDDESPLITPCHCTGSLRFVHQSCLQQWIKSSDTRCCELCKYEFIMETKLKPLRKVRRDLYCSAKSINSHVH